MELEPSTTTASPASGDKHHQDDNNKPPQCMVVSTYQAKINDTHRIVTITWSKNLMNHSLSVTVDKSVTDNTPLTCKVDLKPWPFWSKKGFKAFETDGGRRVDIFWDLRSAKFSGGPEPVGGYYVAVVHNEEVVLLLGDSKMDAYKRTKSRPSLVDPRLISKRENVFGKKCFTTRARFEEGRREHDIMIENLPGGPKESEMRISVDGVVIVHVSTNLYWKFRGNETVLVEHKPVQVFWDVHDWLFCAPGGLGHALFIFKPGAPEKLEEGGDGEGVEVAESGGGEVAAVPEFCFFVYAWRME